MGKVRVVLRPGEPCAIIHPVPKSRKPEESEKDWLNRVFDAAMKKNRFEGLSYYDVEESTLPPNGIPYEKGAREFDEKKGLTINKEKENQIKAEKERKQLIHSEKQRIVEEQAVQSLKDKGLITD